MAERTGGHEQAWSTGDGDSRERGRNRGRQQGQGLATGVQKWRTGEVTAS